MKDFKFWISDIFVGDEKEPEPSFKEENYDPTFWRIKQNRKKIFFFFKEPEQNELRLTENSSRTRNPFEVQLSRFFPTRDFENLQKIKFKNCVNQ